MGQTESKSEGAIQDARYGQAELIRKDGQLCVKKKIVVADPQTLKMWQNRKAVQHPNIVRVVSCELIEEKELCSNYQFVQLVLEYIPLSLHKEIQTRKIKQDFFSEEELWRMLNGAIDALALLQSKHVSHQNIRPMTLSYERDMLKLCENPGGNTAFVHVFHNPDSWRHYDLAPKLIEAVYQQNSHPRHNIYKSDVFSLGMSILQASLLDFCRECYDYENGTFEVSKYVAFLRSNYSELFTQTVMTMLEHDEELRPDFRQLQQQIQSGQLRSVEASLVLNSHKQQGNPDLNNSIVISSTDLKPPQPVGDDVFERIAQSQIVELQPTKTSKSDPIDVKLERKNKIRITQQSIRLKESQAKIQQLQQSQTKLQQSQVQTKPRNLGYYHFQESIKLHKQIEEQILINPSALSKQKPPLSDISFAPPLPKISASMQQNAEPQIKGFPSLDWSFSRDRGDPNQSSQLSDGRPPFSQPYFTEPQRPVEIIPLIDRNRPSQNVSLPFYDKRKYEFTPSYESYKQTEQSSVRSERQPISNIQNHYRYQPEPIPKVSTQQSIRSSTAYDKFPLMEKRVDSLYKQDRFEWDPEEQNRLDEIKIKLLTGEQKDNGYFNSQSTSVRTRSIQNQLQQITSQSNFTKEMNSLISDAKRRVYQTIEYNDGSVYKGEVQNGCRDGFGKLLYCDGGFYEGQWRNDKMDGFGALYYDKNKKAYEGQFKEDQFHGFGTLYNKDPVTLSGEFDCRDFDKIGNYWIRYVGNFVRDLKDGQGALFLSNNQKYQGEFKDDYIDGPGQFGSVSGRWKCNKLIESNRNF